MDGRPDGRQSALRAARRPGQMSAHTSAAAAIRTSCLPKGGSAATATAAAAERDIRSARC
eukprot:scaffold665_cov341-Prasinococcus_capsulatus_cf.AAC.1